MRKIAVRCGSCIHYSKAMKNAGRCYETSGQEPESVYICEKSIACNNYKAAEIKGGQMNNKFINAGIKSSSNNYINGGEPMEELSFDTHTGKVVCRAEENEAMQKIYDKTDNTGLVLAVIAIMVLVCLLVAGL